jgi:cation diffusion facilitator CzcD-associated flavoprotein CzcO
MPMSDSSVPDGAAAKRAALLEKYEVERLKRLRADQRGHFQATDGAFAHYIADPYVETPLTREPIDETADVVIVGGGWSGMLTAVNLRRVGVDDIRIIESGGDFGGVWYWNRYPECRCDLDSYIYMPLLEETGFIPSEKYARSDEIRAHAQRVGKEFDLYRHAVFQTQVTELRWSEVEARWIVRTNRGDTFRARFAFVGVGPLNYPKLPAIPGIGDFKGHSFHSSRWDYAYTGGDASGNLTGLQDKRVALIGTGSSGIQCVAPLGLSAKQLYVVQRTPPVVGHRGNKPTDPEWVKSLQPGWSKARMRNFDGIFAGVVSGEDLVGDQWTVFWGPPALDPDASPEEIAEVVQRVDFERMEEIRARVERIVKDPETAEALKPYYGRFCRRPTFNDDFLPTFNRPNVKLIDTQGRGLDCITENAIVFDGKTYEVDCIIYATGFELLTTSHKTAGFQVIGRGGQTLDEKWSKAVRSLHGIYTHGFPNLFFVAAMRQSAPTINFPHVSSEQAAHAAKVVRRMLDEAVRIMHVSREAEDRWCETIAAKAKFDIEYIRACTPSLNNNDGDLEQLAKNPFTTAYGDGPFAYFDVLAQWRAGDILNDLELTRK